MKRVEKTNKIMVWVLLSLTTLSILSYFLPMYTQKYTSSYSPSTTNTVYLYNSYAINPIVSQAIIIPIFAIIFMFTSFRNNRLFSFGFLITTSANNIFCLLYMSRIKKSEYASPSYEYSYKFGYYFLIVVTILLIVAILGSLIIFIIAHHSNHSQNLNYEKNDHIETTEIEILKNRIKTLDELKAANILTEIEYEQKRKEIVDKFKI